MLRTGKTSALQREALPVAEDASNNREIGHFRTAFISQAIEFHIDIGTYADSLKA